jgi:hypothetical protein
MLYRVEVRSNGTEVGAAMSNMRTWLDHQRFEPDSFRQIETQRARFSFRLEFKIEREAVAFAAAFGGRVVVPSRDEPLAAA